VHVAQAAAIGPASSTHTHAHTYLEDESGYDVSMFGSPSGVMTDAR
jgi:hypothetical protein